MSPNVSEVTSDTTNTNFSQGHLSGKDLTIVIGLFFGVFVMGADSFIISPLLPAMAQDFRTSLSAVSYGVTVYAICYAIGSPLFGPLGDRFDRRRLLLLGMAFFWIGTILCATAGNLTEFYIYRALAGLGAAFTMPNVWAFIGSYFSGGPMRRVMGIVMSALSLSIAVGVPLGTALSAISDWHMAFWGSAVLGLIALVLLRLTVPSSKPDAAAQRGYLASYGQVVRTRGAVIGLLVNLSWMFGFYLLYTFLGAFVTDTFGFTTSQSGLVFMAYGAGNFLASFISGSVMSHLGARASIIVPGAASLILALAIGTLGNRLVLLVILLLVLAMAQGFGVPSISTYVVGTVPAHRSTVTSLNSSMLYLGLTLASAVGAPIYTDRSYVVVCVVAAAAFLLAICLTKQLRTTPSENSRNSRDNRVPTRPSVE